MKSQETKAVDNVVEELGNRIPALVTYRLSEAGHPAPDAWQAGLHPDALNTEVKPGVQRFHVNRRLRTVIGKFKENTLNVRAALIDDGETADWDRHLVALVIPCMVRNAPPQPAGEAQECLTPTSDQTTHG